MSAHLRDLAPRYRPVDGPPGAGFLTFQCPACRKHEIGVHVKPGGSGEENGTRYWGMSGTPPDWDGISLTPSINFQLAKSDGSLVEHWHGFITNGEAQP